MGILKKLFRRREKNDWEEVKESLDRKIADVKRPAVRLQKTSEFRVSKFGGTPVVQTDKFHWPRNNGKPMAFLAQLDLAEISQVHRYDWLSKEGVILFFYDVHEMPWGFDPKDRGKWCVLYLSNPDGNAHFPEDMDDEFKIPESFIKPELVEIFPHYDDPSIEILGLTDEESDLYCDLDDRGDEPSHQVGGFPLPVQGNYMELESQLASNGVYVGTPEGYESREAKGLRSGAKDWKLLFQFDSDDALEVMWGDCGTIYFWVQQQKAKRNEFDNSWLVLQCG